MKEISHRGSDYSPASGSLDAISWTGNTVPHGSRSKRWHFLTSASAAPVQPAGLCEDCSYYVSTKTSFLESYVCAASLQAAKVAKKPTLPWKKRNWVHNPRQQETLWIFYLNIVSIIQLNATSETNNISLSLACVSLSMLFPTLYK